LAPLLAALLSVTAQGLIGANLSRANTAQTILEIVRKAHLLPSWHPTLRSVDRRSIRVNPVLDRPLAVHAEWSSISRLVLLRTREILLQSLKTKHLIALTIIVVCGERHQRFEIRVALRNGLVLAARLQLGHQSLYWDDSS